MLLLAAPVQFQGSVMADFATEYIYILLEVFGALLLQAFAAAAAAPYMRRPGLAENV